MEVSTSLNVMYGFGDVTQQLRRVHAAGFNNIDINFADWAGDWLPVLPPDPPTAFSGDNWRDWVEDIRRFGEQTGVFYNQGHASAYELALAEQRSEYFDEMNERAIEAAGILGIPWLVFHTGSLDGPYDKAHRAMLKEKNLKWFDRWVELAARHKVGIAIENMPNATDSRGAWSAMPRYSAEVEDLVDLIDTIDAPHVGVCWDTGHAQMNHLNQGNCLRALGKRLKALHVQDGFGIVDDHTAPFYGTIDWDDVMRGLRDAGYEGWFTFEAHVLVRRVPDSCKDAALVLLRRIGEELAGRYA